jgi:hypothetical protein
MIRILITEAAFAALGGSDPAEQRTSGAWRYGAPPAGMVPMFLLEETLDQLTHARGAGESYSDVILRLAAN